MKDYLLIAIVVMFFVIIFQIAKASEYVGVLKGEDKTRKQNNKINAFFMVCFLVFGLIGAWYCNDLYYGKTLFPQGSASVEGEDIDKMMWMTLGVTGVVFVILQGILFWFSFKYQESDTRKAYYFPHNNKLELIWTVIPAIVLCVLVVFGLKFWIKITGPAPEKITLTDKNGRTREVKTTLVEITGHQFAWEMRYPGADGILGKKNFKLTTTDNNLGVDFNDPYSWDDLRGPAGEMHLPVHIPVKLVINSQDVIHDVGLSHFRMKMDAVPGIPTTLWFTPQYTTKEMKERTNNPDFVYEISCDQMCGKGHFSMRGIIVVESEDDYRAWLAKMKPEYFKVHPEKDPDVKKHIDSMNVNKAIAVNTK